jgi:hypothetical protein
VSGATAGQDAVCFCGHYRSLHDTPDEADPNGGECIVWRQIEQGRLYCPCPAFRTATPDAGRAGDALREVMAEEVERHHDTVMGAPGRIHWLDCSCGWTAGELRKATGGMAGARERWKAHRIDALLALPEVQELQTLADFGRQVRAMHADATPDRPARRDNITALLARFADTHPEVQALLAAEKERDELRATVARVKALIAFYDRHEYASLNVDDLRGTLDGSA